MKDDPQVAGVYAEALLNVVRSAGVDLRTALDEAESLGFLIENRDDLRAFLEGPHIPTENKHALVQKVFEGRIPSYFYNLIRVCIDKNRVFYLIDILLEFVLRVETELGIHEARIRTAIPLDEALRRDVQTALETYTGYKFRPRYVVDPKLIGGIVVQYDDFLIDMSLRGHLLGLREAFKHAVNRIPG